MVLQTFDRERAGFHGFLGKSFMDKNEIVQSKQKNRNSSIELLRIISMFVIVAYHYSLHGGYDKFSSYDFCGGVVFVQFLGLFGKVACSIFALISGYFLILQKGPIKEQYKRIVPLFFEMHFYYFVILIVMLITQVVPVTPAMWIKSLFPMIFGTWYIKYYILLLLAAPFIGNWLRSLDKNTYRNIVLLLLFIWSAIQTLSNAAWNFGEMDFFFVMYILGGYLRLHMGKVSLKKTGIYAVSFIILMMASVLFFDIAGIISGITKFIDYASYFRRYDTVLALGCAVSVFLYTLNFNFYNAIINRISSATLGIYLIHNNAMIDTYIWKVLYPNTEYIYNPYVHAVIKIVIVFSVSLVIDLVRQATIGAAFNKWLEKNYQKIWGCLKWIAEKSGKLIDNSSIIWR